MRSTRLILSFLLLLMTLAISLGHSARPAQAVTTIPGGVAISKATLSIYSMDNVGQVIRIHRITAPWSETEVTWNSFGESYDGAEIGSFGPSLAGWQSVDVTSLFQAWASLPSTNFGFLLEQDPNTPFVQYHSSEFDIDPTLRPKLEVCYADGTCSTIQRGNASQDVVADAYIWQPWPDVNGGFSPVLYTGFINGGQKQTLIRFDFTVTPSAALGDYVWNDLNGNGIQDAGEPGIAGITVNLFQCGGTTPVATTTTDANGLYHFTNLGPGSYIVQFVAPTGFTSSAPYQGGNTATDSNANQSTGSSECVTLNSGDDNTTIDAGLYQPSSLGDFVWNDVNHNGIQDGGEAGMPGQPVTLHTCAGDLIDGTTTDAYGKYLFFNLAPGSYYVQFVALADYLFSPKDQGTNDAVDSDADLATGKTACTDLVAGENDLTWDAGLYQTVSPGTGTPGYWFNHPDAWPVDSITIGGVTYSKGQAIPLMKAPTKGDVTYIMFQALVSAKLNVLIGNDASCIASTITAADSWMSANGPVGSGVKAKSAAWKVGEPLYLTLDDYNNGLMCAAHRD